MTLFKYVKYYKFNDKYAKRRRENDDHLKDEYRVEFAMKLFVEDYERIIRMRRNFIAMNFNAFSFSLCHDKCTIDEESKIAESQFPIRYVNEYVTIKYMRGLMLTHSLEELVVEMYLPER
jgi:hypothetical protein